MYKALNRKTSRLLCAVIIFALILSVIVSLVNVKFFAYADDAEDTTFTQTATHPSNNQFESTGSGSAPKSPSNWTGGGVGGLSGGKTVSGVLDLSSYAKDKDNYKLPEDDIINSPFGTGGSNDTTNRNVLLINILDDGSSTGTAYGYTSSDITFNKNRFYKVNVWVRTGKFATNSGAAIRLNGLGEDVAFTNIDTVSDLTEINSSNKYGWQDYTFYIAASSYENKTVNIGLQVGDLYENKYRPAKGYALFDNVTVFEIAPADFLSAQETERTKVVDLAAHTSDVYGDEFKNDLAFINDLTRWQYVSADTDSTQLKDGIYNGENLFIEDNIYGLTSDPSSSYGKNHDGDSNVLVLSSFVSKDNYRTVAKGMSYTTPVTIKRYHYYRISAWIKSQNTEGGAGATFALSAKRSETDEMREGKNLFATIESCNGNSSNKARGGFEEYSFYVKGSAIKDYEAYIECWLGTKNNKSSGIAIFDNITVEDIAPADYEAFSSNGTVVDFDTHNGADNSSFVSLPDTGITNGKFYNIGTYEDELTFPVVPAGWTKYTTDTVNTDGYSAEAVKTDNAVSGIVPSDSETYYTYNDKFGSPFNTNAGGNNVLMLYSSTPTAYCYRSSSFTAAANTPGELTVDLCTQNMNDSDYGASLVLKDDTRVIASIEGIKETTYGKYTFYIEPASADVSTLSLEIWLGGNDRKSNKTKLSSGNVFVREVSYAAITDDTSADNTVTQTAAAKFAVKKEACDNAKLRGTNVYQAAYSYKSVDMYAYDAYDDSYLKQPFNWQISSNTSIYSDAVYYGIFDPASIDRDNMLVPQDFRSEERSILMLRNALEAYSALSYTGSINVAADTYYKVEVTLKVNIPKNQSRKNAVGATLSLIGGSSDAQFKNITDTSEAANGITDNEAFRTYTFFIKPDSADTSLSLRISLGDSDYDKQCSGIVYISNISYTDITEAAYNEASSDIDNGNKFAMLTDLSVAAPDDNDSDTDNDNSESTLDWWLIPSILFAIAILIAIIGFVVRKLVEKRKNKKGIVQKLASYDRTATLNREHNKNADETEKVNDVVEGDENYEAFDDDTVAAPAQTAATDEVKQVENTEAQENEEVSENTEETTETESENKPEEKPEQPKVSDTSFIDRFDD